MPLPNDTGNQNYDFLLGIFNVTSNYLSGGGIIHGNGPGTFYWDDSPEKTQFRGIAEILLSYFSIEDASFREGKGGEVTIIRTGGTTTAQTLRVQSRDGSATIADDDYAAITLHKIHVKGAPGVDGGLH